MNPRRFVFPNPSTIAEDDDARAKRRSEVTSVLEQLFDATVEQLGLDEARRVWDQVAARNKRPRGRPRKREVWGLEALILRWWEKGESYPDPQKRIRRLARSFHTYAPEYKNIQPESLEKRIRLLVKELREGRLVRDGDNYKYTRTQND